MGDVLLAYRLITAILAICLVVALLSVGRADSTDKLFERGSYLVNTIAACGRCHTPRDPQGSPIGAMRLAGGFAFDDGVIGHVVVPNITPDRETGIGNWTEAQIVTALRNGTRPDGTIVGPPMPVDTYRELADRDAAAIARYLHRIKPIRHAVGRTQFKTPPSAHDPGVTHVAEPPRQDRLAYGAYLAATVGHCIGCHTRLKEDGSSLDRRLAYAGGREMADFGDVRKTMVSGNITSDPEDGLGKWSDEDIKRAITTGIRPDGTRLGRTMPYEWYARVAPADLDALVAFLRTVKPLKSPPPGD
jgi:mono/diheme cytochrome c family protein